MPTESSSSEPPEPYRGRAPAAGCEITVQNPCGHPLTAARRVRPWLTTTVATVAPGYDSFAVRFVTDREMHRLNRDFRQHDRPTDVLSFPGDGAAREAGGHLGDVAIAVPTLRRQAARLGHAPERELRVLLLHGVLHCLGYDHEVDDGEMERLEQSLRRRLIDHA